MEERTETITDITPYLEVLRNNPFGILASREGEQLRTQVMTLMLVEGERLYFCTKKDKALYRQLREHPEVSYLQWQDDYRPIVSVSGQARFSEDLTLRERILSGSGGVPLFFNQGDDPDLVVFYIEIREMEVFDHGKTRCYRKD